MSKSANKAALHDMKEWLSEMGWTYINVSKRALFTTRDRDINDIY